MDQTLPLDVKTEEWLYEHRSGPIRTGTVHLLPFSEAIQLPGFISSFGFPSSTADYIREVNNTAGMRGMQLSTELLYIDFDDAENDAADAETTLQKLGLKYELFSTGRIGRYHFHVPCVALTRSDLPMRVADWVSQNFKGYDPKIYMTSGVIRTPGTYHSKQPGKFKHSIHVEDGAILDLMKATKDVMPKVYIGAANGDQDADAEQLFQGSLIEPCYEGGRNRQVYRRAYLARLAGYQMREAEDLLRSWNEMMVYPPLREGEVLTTVRSAYR